MQAFDVEKLADALDGEDARYREFLRVTAMSCGLYWIPKGAADPQSPHIEDEVFHVLHARARIRVGSEDHEARPGSLVFVLAALEHRFHDIVDNLTALVLFAPAERSPKR